MLVLCNAGGGLAVGTVLLIGMYYKATIMHSNFWSSGVPLVWRSHTHEREARGSGVMPIRSLFCRNVITYTLPPATEVQTYVEG